MAAASSVTQGLKVIASKSKTIKEGREGVFASAYSTAQGDNPGSKINMYIMHGFSAHFISHSIMVVLVVVMILLCRVVCSNF